jgi:hypothetical protein
MPHIPHTYKYIDCTLFDMTALQGNASGTRRNIRSIASLHAEVNHVIGHDPMIDPRIARKGRRHAPGHVTVIGHVPIHETVITNVTKRVAAEVAAAARAAVNGNVPRARAGARNERLDPGTCTHCKRDNLSVLPELSCLFLLTFSVCMCVLCLCDACLPKSL